MPSFAAQFIGAETKRPAILTDDGALRGLR
jgi:hypothetical protein